MATTLLQLRTRVRQLADIVNSDFVTDAELDARINVSYKELYGLLVRASLHRSEEVALVECDGSESYRVPDDFFGLIGIYRSIGEDKIPLERFPDKFRPGSRTGDATMYRISGSDLVLYPKPSSGVYDMVYIPVPDTATADDDVIDGVLGWEEFLVLDVAIYCLEKEESDTSKLELKRDRILKRIQDEAQIAEFTETPRIGNSRDDWRQLTDPADYMPYRNDDWDL
jgi:hypothetical protein